MIRYALTCAKGHSFESWFQSATAFDTLLARGLVACAICGNSTVEKALMAPSVAARTETGAALRDQNSPQEQALAALRREIEAKSEYVGAEFATEARRMHEGEAPERAIHGEAKPDEARRLIEDGVPVLPLPFLPGRKTN